MRVFVAGATGVIGIRLVPLLIAAGHHVRALTRSADKRSRLEELGAEAVVGNVFDVGPLTDAMVDFHPDAVVDQLTDLPDDPDLIPLFADANARIRREGTDNLLAAASRAGASRLLAQSVAWPIGGDGGAAVAYLEAAVLAAGGTVLRYGRLYGPDTYYEDSLPPPPRVHVEEAARQTVPTLDDAPGVITLTDP